LKEFRRFFEALEREGVRYLVIGGVAVNLYGIERATGDVDISLAMSEENIARFIGVIKGLGFKPNVPVKIEDLADAAERQKWVTDKGMVVLSMFDPKNSFFTIDVMVEETFDFDKAYKERSKIRAWDTVLSVASMKDLIQDEGKDRKAAGQGRRFLSQEDKQGVRR
jgi:hypothetical protein